MDPHALMGLMIPILAVVGGFTFMIYRAWARHQERMAMIEAGMHPDLPELDDGDMDEELGRRDPQGNLLDR